MRRANADNSHNITVSMVHDFFNLSAPKPRTEAFPKVKGRQPDEFIGSTREAGINFKLMKTEDPESYRNSEPNLPTEADFPELNDDFQNLDVTDNLPNPVPVKVDEDEHIFENYSFEHTYSPKLPITNFQNEVLDTIESNSVTVIQGATGSGKTTQVPQYILDHYIKQKRYCNILVTQPRRIAAISIAKRVCQERSWELGGLVGYQVARDKSISGDTRISYVTTGVLLQKLISAKSLNEYTHIILDEVHERDQDTDFALLVVRKLLRTNSKHVKVVLMSATLDSDMFSRYFSLPINGRLEGAPVVTVEGRSYPVEEIYLNEIIHSVHKRSLPLLDPGEPGIDEEQYHTAACLIGQLDSWEIDVQGATDNGFAGERGSVLVFLPGKEHIKDMDKMLNDVCWERHLWVLPLHSQITNEEQSQVFRNPPKPQEGNPRYRKIILSTNIAESSITVPDVKYVIDFCLVKCLICDPDTNYQSLRMQWTSHASATQRKGRAGRVSAGKCFRLVTNEFYDRCMEPYSVPEFKRAPLEQIILKVKLLDLGAPKSILALALQPPDVRDIERTILILKELGALTTKMQNGAINPYDGELTFLGRVVGEMPCDIRIGKLLVLGHVFGVLEEAIVIGACLSQKSFFAQPFKQELNAYRWKMSWSNYSNSDCLASLNAYREWKKMNETRGFGRKGEIGWCKSKFIQRNRILEVEKVVRELTERLARFNIRTFRALHQRRYDSTQHDELILKIVICGSFYPNYFKSGDIDEREALKTMSGHDPFTTVMVKGLPIYGQHYSSAIARMFRPCGQGRHLYFEGRRAYVEFERPQNSYFPILPAVYLALKMRYLQMPLALYIAEDGQKRMIEKTAKNVATSRANTLRTDRVMASIKDSSNETQRIDGPQELELPEVGFMDVYVSEVIDAGFFWAQRGDMEYAAKLEQLMSDLNDYNGTQHEPMPSYVPRGALCLALFPEDERFYRAKVISWKNSQVEVMYVDYGNSCTIPIQFLRKIREEHTKLPFQAFKCHLCYVRPAFGEWDEEANERFKDLTWDKKLVAKIFCRLHGALRVDLIDTVSSEDDIHIHQVLIAENWAQGVDESYDSIRAHEDAVARLEVRNSLGASADDSETTGWIESDLSLADAQLTGDYDRKEGVVTKVSLSGPFSPYEMQFYSMTCVGRLRATKIERDSVNSVALNDEPQDKHERFLVASNIGINTTGTVMIARDTTLMPNIHGLAALVGLVFAPCAEFRTDKSKDRYTGAIIGLGSDPTTGEALLPDHDIEVVFDFAFVQEDLVKINSCRNAINLAVGSRESVAEWGTAAVQKIQHNARRVLLDLILSSRDDRQMCPSGKAYHWNQIDSKDLLSPYHQEDLEDGQPILYPLHYGVAVTEATYADTIPDHIVQRRMHVQSLHEKSGGSSQPFPSPIVCELCNVRCRHPRGLRMHLETRAHCMEERILFDDRYTYNH